MPRLPIPGFPKRRRVVERFERFFLCDPTIHTQTQKKHETTTNTASG